MRFDPAGMPSLLAAHHAPAGDVDQVGAPPQAPQLPLAEHPARHRGGRHHEHDAIHGYVDTSCRRVTAFMRDAVMRAAPEHAACGTDLRAFGSVRAWGSPPPDTDEE
jgi:hypothetical protein